MKAYRAVRLGSRGKPEQSRAAILKAAINEFADHGIAGARTDAIARAARVNKALLYYYFKDKEAIYQAVLDHVFSGLRDTVVPVLEGDLPPRQKLLNYVTSSQSMKSSVRYCGTESRRENSGPSTLRNSSLRWLQSSFSTSAQPR